MFCAMALIGGCTLFNNKHTGDINRGVVEKKKIAICPVDAGIYGNTTNQLDSILEKIIMKQEREQVVSCSYVSQKLTKDKTLQDKYNRYYSMLSVLSFSDERLIADIGEAFGCDFLLFPIVEYWGHTIEDKKEYAKVALKFIIVDTHSGKVVWRSMQNDKARNMFGKADLEQVATALAKSMLLKRVYE